VLVLAGRVLAGRVLARRPSRKSEGRVFLRCSTAWCISSHEVVYFGVRPMVLPSTAYHLPAKFHCQANGLMTDRRFLFFLTESVWPSMRSEPADSGRVDGSMSDRRISAFSLNLSGRPALPTLESTTIYRFSPRTHRVHRVAMAHGRRPAAAPSTQ
jgi:hypothetical protein